MKRALSWFLRILGGAFLLATVALFVVSAWRFKVSTPGSSAEYWEYLCGVQLPSFAGHQQYFRDGGAYPVVDGSAYYFTQMHHERLLYRVPVADVVRDLPQVRESLAASPLPPSTTCDRFDEACLLVVGGAPRRAACAKRIGSSDFSLTDARDLEALRIALAEHPEATAQQDAAFRDRLERGRRVWLTFAFEAFYLTAWLMFVVGVRPFDLSWGWRAGLAPFLLFLRFFLGFAPMTLTFGPPGGFVYPLYLSLAAVPMHLVPCSTFDSRIGARLPNLLGWFSQLPGLPMAYTRMLCIGPASSLVFGAALVAIASATLFLWRRVKGLAA